VAAAAEVEAAEVEAAEVEAADREVPPPLEAFTEAVYG